MAVIAFGEAGMAKTTGNVEAEVARKVFTPKAQGNGAIVTANVDGAFWAVSFLCGVHFSGIEERLGLECEHVSADGGLVRLQGISSCICLSSFGV